MGEIAINPIHNVHKKYREMNLVNPYIFAPTAPTYNTYIGGVASTISTASALATKLAISVGAISNFTVVGSDIKCKITGSYEIPGNFLASDESTITYYDDMINGLVTKINNQAFRFSTTLKYAYFPNCTSIANAGFQVVYDTCILYIPRCTDLGGSSANNIVFDANPPFNNKVYCHPSLSNNNSGSPDGDLSAVGSVSYVANFIAPNAITNLLAGTIYSTQIQLNFTAPSSTNTIDYYEVFKDGVFVKKIVSGDFVEGLTASTLYSFSVFAVDIYFNRSLISNILNVSSNTIPVPMITTGLVSFYKFESNVNDAFGTNHATPVSVSYASGKIGNAVVFNGTTSQFYAQYSAFDFFGTANFSYNLWVNLDNLPASTKEFDVVAIQNGTDAVTSDKQISIYANGSVGFYGYDGGVQIATTATGLISSSTWIMLTGTYDGVNLRVYVNGVLKATKTCASTYNMTTPRLVVERLSSGAVIPYKGMIDLMGIFNICLSQDRITKLYNGGAGQDL